MKQVFLITAILIGGVIHGQNLHYIQVAVLSTQNAYPFGKFTGLFREILHPGMEASYGKIIKPREKQEWFREYRLGWFYHRYVQLAIPLTIHFGYRYKFGTRFSAQTVLGAGYMHSIPAAEKFKLDAEGNYQNNKGLGRMQATASFDLGLGYILNPSAERPLRIMAGYQQRLQFPFVRSYVPLLPYSSFLLGIAMPVKKSSNPSTTIQ